MKLFKTITATTLAVAAALVTTTITNAKTEVKKASFGYTNSATVNYDSRYYKNQEVTFSVNPSMSTYFKHLYTNIGYNHYGSCGYVATGMLLSYYDTFWDDGFIAEKFDYSRTPNDNSVTSIVEYSPGVRNEYGVSSGVTQNSADNILEHYRVLAGRDYFVPYLHVLGNKAKFYSNILNKEIPYYNQANVISAAYGEKYNSSIIGAFGENQLGDFLKYYLDNETSFKGKYSIKSKSIQLKAAGDTDDTEIRKFMTEYIDKGYPVLVCTNDWATRPTSSNPTEYERLSLTEGHVQVAYDYVKDSNGKIKFNTHYGIRYYNGTDRKHGNTDISLTTSDTITEAYVLVPSFKRTDSNNYIYKSGDSIAMSGMTGMLSSTMEITDYVSDSIKKINKVNYTAPNRQLMTFSTDEDYDTSFYNINLSYRKEYRYNYADWFMMYIKTRGKADLEDFKEVVPADIYYYYDEDQDTSGEYWDENCYLSLTVNDKRDTHLSFDVEDAKTLHMFSADYLF